MGQRVVSAIMMALLMFASAASAQQGTSELRGRVVDSQGAMLPGVTVTVRANFPNPSGKQASMQFLLLTAYSTSYTPRKIQVGARFEC